MSRQRGKEKEKSVKQTNKKTLKLYPLLFSLTCPEVNGRNTGVGCHFLLQGIFLIQGLNLHLLHCRQILYC